MLFVSINESYTWIPASAGMTTEPHMELIDISKIRQGSYNLNQQVNLLPLKKIFRIRDIPSHLHHNWKKNF
jgi:hypothetical protein